MLCMCLAELSHEPQYCLALRKADVYIPDRMSRAWNGDDRKTPVKPLSRLSEGSQGELLPGASNERHSVPSPRLSDESKTREWPAFW